MRLAKFILHEGHSVQMLKMNPFVEGAKNPDCLINEKIFELKTTISVSRASLDGIIKKASKQANNLLLEVKSDLSIN